MFVVVEFNQASHQPSVWDDTIYYDRDEAEHVRDCARADLLASGSGRRERYAVAELTIDDEE